VLHCSMKAAGKSVKNKDGCRSLRLAAWPCMLTTVCGIPYAQPVATLSLWFGCLFKTKLVHVNTHGVMQPVVCSYRTCAAGRLCCSCVWWTV